MLFNSYIFIIGFLPIVYLGAILIANRFGSESSNIWLVICSLFFYGWWDYSYIGLIIFSIVLNYTCGRLISKYSVKIILYLGITANLVLLGYYKYVNFFLNNINAFTEFDIKFTEIVLPLAISFFTFQQIAYLVDVWRKETKEYSFVHYSLFILFFPQLLAGPIVHHKELIHQFSNNIKKRFSLENFVVGVTIFSIGLFKKVILADTAEGYATPMFDAAHSGEIITFVEAWLGVISYTFQIYFDFSGYSDMAIGIARLFGILLPINFNSPYKATSITDFWRRWHITLSIFLEEYLYFSLGGNKKGEIRRVVNLLVTMLLGGLWHGAGWTFLLWGGLHGIYLIINHLWRKLFGLLNIRKKYCGYFSKLVSRILTLLFVIIAWVVFRADSMDAAISIYKGMYGEYGFVLPEFYLYRLGSIGGYLADLGLDFSNITYFYGTQQIFTLLIMTIVLAMPNTQEFLCRYFINEKYYYNSSCSYFKWRPTPIWAFLMSLLFVISVLSITKVSEFIYFQF